MSSAPVLAPMRLIKETVAAHFNVSVMDIDSPRRVQDVIIARHVAIYLCRILTRASYPAIGKHFGNRDHSSIVHAMNSMEGRLDSDSGLLETMQVLRDELAPRITETRDINRAVVLLGVRIISAEDVIRARIDAVFASLDAHIRRSPFTVLERLESLAADLERRDRAVEDARREAAE